MLDPTAQGAHGAWDCTPPPPRRPKAHGPRQRAGASPRLRDAARRTPSARRDGAPAPRTSSSSAPRSRARRGGSGSSSSIPASSSRPTSDPSCTSSTASGASGRTPSSSRATTATSRAPRARSSGRRRRSTSPAPGRAPMIRLAAPEARAIVLLRDPVERYVSGLSHHERGGLVNDEEGSGQRAFGDRMRVVTDAICRGQYATQLEWLLQAYPRERLLVLQYERCAADAAGQLARTFAFLGLAPHRAARRGAGPAAQHGQAREARRARPQHLELLRRYYAPEVAPPPGAARPRSTCRSGPTSATWPDGGRVREQRNGAGRSVRPRRCREEQRSRSAGRPTRAERRSRRRGRPGPGPRGSR